MNATPFDTFVKHVRQVLATTQKRLDTSWRLVQERHAFHLEDTGDQLFADAATIRVCDTILTRTARPVVKSAEADMRHLIRFCLRQGARARSTSPSANLIGHFETRAWIEMMDAFDERVPSC